jgi:hypothetical protein
VGAWRAAALATEFGFAVVGSLVGGIALGLYLDRRLGTAPGLFILGLVGGLVFSIYLIYAIYRVQVQPRRAGAGSRKPAGAVGQRTPEDTHEDRTA